MIGLKRLAALAVAAVLLTAASASAQQGPPNKAARDNYDKGVKAAQAKNWQGVVDAMNAAIAIDSAARSYRDGVQTENYFPQYYLFVAYVGLKDFVNAKKLIAQRGTWPAKLVSDAKSSFDAVTAEDRRVADAGAAEAKRVADAAEAKRAADAAEAKRVADAAEAKRLSDAAEAKRISDAAEARRQADAKAAADRQARTEYDQIAGRANTAYNQHNWGAAIDAFNQAKTKLPDVFGQQQLQAKLNDATKQKGDRDFFDNAVRVADAAFAKNSWPDAATNYRAAQSRLPAEFANQKLQPKLDKADTEFKKMGAELARKAEIDSMVKSANAALGGKKFDDAIAGYNSVKTKYPAEFQQQKLQAKIDEATRGKTALADAKAAEDRRIADAKAAEERRIADAKAAADKAAADKAAAEKNAASAAQVAEQAAHDGLVALLKGDASKASPLLEQAISGAPKASQARRATLSAYLAVAYATQSIQKSDKALESKARDQYKQALQIQKGYKLEDSLVSPQVKKILTGTN